MYRQSQSSFVASTRITVCQQTWNENKGDQVVGFIFGCNTVMGEGGMGSSDGNPPTFLCQNVWKIKQGT